MSETCSLVEIGADLSVDVSDSDHEAMALAVRRKLPEQSGIPATPNQRL